MVEVEQPAAGGDGLGHLADGRVVFVTGGLPGERVEVEIDRSKRDYAHGVVRRVLHASSDRIEPCCPNVARGCGGCDLAHLAVEAQPSFKASVVVDALRRLGRIENPTVEVAPPLPADSFRTTLRVAANDGHAGFRRRASHQVLAVDECLVAHPALEDLLSRIDLAGADEALLRVGSAAGQRLVVVDPSARGVTVPDDVILVGQDELDRGATAFIEELVLGETLRVSSRSFFQTRPDGAAALVETVFGAIGRQVRDREIGGPAGLRLVDAYGGVGLFGATATGQAGMAAFGAVQAVVCVERNPSSVRDARHNLADRPVEVVEGDVDSWVASPADVVIADPSRHGLGPAGVRSLAATGAAVVVLVSCDAAPMGRDARLLTEAGYEFDGSTLVDLFPQTHHVEVVSTFTRR